MSRILAGTYKNGVSLTSLSDNPLTVASTGSITSAYHGIALYCGPPSGKFGLYWNLTNYGHVAGGGTGSSGVVIEDGGDLVNGGSNAGIAKPLPADLFSPRRDCGFTTATQRFSYDAATGALYFDADGIGSRHSATLVAVLDHHPTLSAADLFFVS
jgi:hypothetical protein